MAGMYSEGRVRARIMVERGPRLGSRLYSRQYKVEEMDGVTTYSSR